MRKPDDATLHALCIVRMLLPHDFGIVCIDQASRLRKFANSGPRFRR
jgi:hypothetical protein